MSDFYKRLDEAEQANRIKRIFANRPDNLHDYQGCANDAATRLSPHPSGEKETDPICRNCDEHKSNHGELPISGFLYCRKGSKRFEPISALDKLVRDEMKDGLYDKVPVEPSQTESSPQRDADPCKMTDAEYEEYIYGPDRAKWPTNEPIESAPQPQQENAVCRHDGAPIYRIGEEWFHFADFAGDHFHDPEPALSQPQPAEPCEWYGKSLGEHDWIDVPGGKRCTKCKIQFANPQPAESDGFGDWWNTQGRLFMAGNDIHVQRAVMGVAERAWQASRQSRNQEIEPLMSLLELHEKDGGLDCPKINEDCGICDSCKLKKLVQQYRAAAKGQGK